MCTWVYLLNTKMKKYFFIFIGLIVYINSYSQIHFGVAGYTGLGTIYNNYKIERELEEYKNKYRNNWMGGGFIAYDLSGYNSIELGIYYNQLRSFWGKYINQNVNGKLFRFYFEEIERKVDFLTIPITYQYSLKRFKFNIGPQYSFLLKNYSDVHIYQRSTGINRYETEKYNIFINHDYSITLDISYKIFNNLFVEVKYNQGLINISNKEYNGDNFYAASRQFLLGFKYSLVGTRLNHVPDIIAK